MHMHVLLTGAERISRETDTRISDPTMCNVLASRLFDRQSSLYDWKQPSTRCEWLTHTPVSAQAHYVTGELM